MSEGDKLTVAMINRAIEVLKENNVEPPYQMRTARSDWHIIRKCVHEGMAGAAQCGPLLTTSMLPSGIRTALGRVVLKTAIGWVEVMGNEHSTR